MAFAVLWAVLAWVAVGENVLASSKLGSREKPVLRSIKLDQEYLFPASMSITGDNCFGNNLISVTNGQQLRVQANREFILYLNTEFSESYYNLKHIYGEFFEDITMNSLVLSTKEAYNGTDLHVVKLPVTLNCQYNVHPYFRLKAYLSIKFYQQNVEDKRQYNLLLVCPKADEIKAFVNFYVPGYIIFWMMVNLSLQVYHNYVRDLDHFITFIIYLIGSMIVQNDLLAYFCSGIILFLIVLKEKRGHTMNNKMFTLYAFFIIIISLQVVLTFYGGKYHQLWNSFWIALDNFIILHISMFLILRLVKLSRFRHVFWYFIIVSCFSLLYQGNNNRFFQIQFKNPLNLTCITIQVFFPIMMLPISNFLSTITNWMHRVVSVGIMIASVLPLDLAIRFMAFFLFTILFFEIYHKNLSVIRHRC